MDRYIVINLKQNFCLEEHQHYAHQLKKILPTKVKLIVCPSSPFLSCYRDCRSFLGAQDLSRYPEGSYTGEISAKQLASLDVKYALVGHSERREFFNEDSKIISEKVANLLKSGIRPILIVGETLEQKNKNGIYMALEKQLATVLNDFKREEIKNVIIAYEPIWAIDSYDNPEVCKIDEIVAFIKTIILNYYKLNLPILYGGSINEENIDELLKIKGIEGFLIGTASLDVNKVQKMIDILNK